MATSRMNCCRRRVTNLGYFARAVGDISSKKIRQYLVYSATRPTQAAAFQRTPVGSSWNSSTVRHCGQTPSAVYDQSPTNLFTRGSSTARAITAVPQAADVVSWTVSPPINGSLRRVVATATRAVATATCLYSNGVVVQRKREATTQRRSRMLCGRYDRNP